MTKTLASLHVDGGFDFHQLWLDLPYGRYQLLWETQSETMDPTKVVKAYHAALHDVGITEITCTKLRKSYISPTAIHILQWQMRE